MSRWDSLCVSLLLSTLETTIVSTALVSIVDALHGFDRSGWVVTSYLLTYTGESTLQACSRVDLGLTLAGFLIIYSKLSDILGCKLMLLSAITIFTIFSIACGLAESMLQLSVPNSSLSSQCLALADRLASFCGI